MPPSDTIDLAGAAVPGGQDAAGAQRVGPGRVRAVLRGAKAHDYVDAALPIYPPLHASILLSVFTLIHQCIHLSNHPSHLSIIMLHISMHPRIHASMHPCIHASMHPRIHASTHPCIHASMHPCIHAPMHPCTHACIHVYICEECRRKPRMFVLEALFPHSLQYCRDPAKAGRLAIRN